MKSKNSIKLLFALSLVMFMGFFTSCSDDEQVDDRNPVAIAKTSRTALLLCSFGSTYDQPQATYDQVIKDYKEAFPNVDIYMSFTSRTIVSRVYAEIGKAYSQPDLWLTAIGKAGYDTVYVQSLHIIPGEEYLSLMNTDVKKNFMVPFPKVVVAKGACLLENESDVTDVANIVYDYYKTRLDAGEVVVLMGHGNPDSEYTHANLRYLELETKLQELSGEKNIFIGTVDWGEQMFTHIREELAAYALRKNKAPKDITVSLSPLMSIAGDHAQNDLLGALDNELTVANIDPYESDHDASFSWKLKLEKLGYIIDPIGSTTNPATFNVVGLADIKAIRTIWINHMKKAIDEADSWNGHLGI